MNPANDVTLPQPIELDKEDGRKAKKLLSAATAHRKFMENMMQMGREKQAELDRKQQAFWAEMQAKHGIDVVNTHWAPAEDGSALVPVSMSLGYAAPSKQG